MPQTAEHSRLASYRTRESNWKKWGPYVSERAWGTVREDYSPNGDVWGFFPHDHARSKTYRWNEDGIAGISDRNQHICFSLALWNGNDPILKERMFGLAGPKGNHGEDVKEYYFYLENTPTHSYMKTLYKYPQDAYPYEKLVEENQKRSYGDAEYELIDTGIFDQNRYFDVFVEYAKAREEDIIVQITVINRSEKESPCYILPTIWFRNTWSWGYPKGPTGDEPGKPILQTEINADNTSSLLLTHPVEGQYHLYTKENPELVFTENETNYEKLYKTSNTTPFVKDAFHRYLIEGETSAVNPKKEGTKACAIYKEIIPGGQKHIIQLRLSKNPLKNPFADFAAILTKRVEEMEEFYKSIQSPTLNEDLKKIQRAALSGMLWNKQFYNYDILQWQKGDPALPPPDKNRPHLRNHGWEHLTNFDVLSMPDKWEYPYFCSWDTAFHCIPLLLIDPDYTKRLLTLMTREWYMHPSGQLAAYEWSFSDVNPPVHAWATWRCYKIDAKQKGKQDVDFLKGIFTKLLINFTWWINKKDKEGNNIFQGGFLGMDNISVFDRSRSLPTGGRIDQSDGTAWMGFYCITMMKIALELSQVEPFYQDIASKFFEHFLRIAGAMANCGGQGQTLWNEEDGFFYDVLHLPNQKIVPLKVRSLVGLLPLFAVETIEPEYMTKVPVFSRRVDWFSKKRPQTISNMACMHKQGIGDRRLLALITKDKLLKILQYMFDENEFLSEYGIRSVSKYHEKHPYTLACDGHTYTVSYIPGESNNGLFGGNSNWRGPIWMPMNFLLIESLQKFHHYYGDELKVEFPTGSGKFLTLWEISQELSKRLIKLFMKDSEGKRPIYGRHEKLQEDPNWNEYLLFNEYFHGDNGIGLGASHQTGWTGLIAKLIQQSGYLFS